MKKSIKTQPCQPSVQQCSQPVVVMPLPAPLLLQTTHKEKAFHGFGTKSIARIVEKYGGNLTFSNENKTFTLTAVFFFGKSKGELLKEGLNNK